MRYGLLLYGIAGYLVGRDSNFPARWPVWLRRYDPEAHDGIGDIEWTEDPKQALGFDRQSDAMALYYAAPQRRPRRPDGRPNRPLTAFHVSVEEIPGA